MSETQSGILYPLTQMAFDNSQAGNTTPTLPTLLIGQTLVAQPMVVTPVFSVSQAEALFGPASILDQMFSAYFAMDQLGPIYCLPVPDPSGGAAASGSFVMATSGSGLTVGGTLCVYIAGMLVQVAAVAGDTGPSLATKLANAINSTPMLPVTATVTGTPAHTVLVTARHLGLLGNDIDLRINYLGLAGGQVMPSGMSVAIIAMAGGAGTPMLTGLAALLGDQNYRCLVHPWTDSGSMTVFAQLMSFNGGRWSPTRKSWGHCWTARSDTAANLATFGPTNNDPHSTVLVYETGSPTPEWSAAAMFAAASMPSLRQQPNQPLQTLQLEGFQAPNASGPAGSETAWNKTTWQTLLGLGCAMAQYDRAGNAYILRAVTTYQTNAYGQQDQSYLDTETMYLLMAQSDFLSSLATQQWGRSLAADDGTVFGAGLPVQTPKSVKAALITAYNQMMAMGWVEDAQAFIDACTVTRDATNPSTFDILFTPYLVVGLRGINITNQFRLFSAAVTATVLAA